jgi:hypothetical protein
MILASKWLERREVRLAAIRDGLVQMTREELWLWRMSPGKKRSVRSQNRDVRLGEHKPNDAKHGEERGKTTGKPNAV